MEFCGTASRSPNRTQSMEPEHANPTFSSPIDAVQRFVSSHSPSLNIQHHSPLQQPCHPFTSNFLCSSSAPTFTLSPCHPVICGSCVLVKPNRRITNRRIFQRNEPPVSLSASHDFALKSNLNPKAKEFFPRCANRISGNPPSLTKETTGFEEVGRDFAGKSDTLSSFILFPSKPDRMSIFQWTLDLLGIRGNEASSSNCVASQSDEEKRVIEENDEDPKSLESCLPDHLLSDSDEEDAK